MPTCTAGYFDTVYVKTFKDKRETKFRREFRASCHETRSTSVIELTMSPKIT